MNAIEALKYLGIGIALISTIWATLAKVSYEDEQGRKRLTAAGYTSMAFAIAGSLIATLSYGFELADQRASAFAEAQEQQRRDNAAAAQHARDQAKADAQHLSDRLAGEARAARQELLIETRAQQAANLQRLLAQRQRLERLEESQSQTERLTGEISRAVLTLDGTFISAFVTADLSEAPRVGFEQRMLDARSSGSLGNSLFIRYSPNYSPFFFRRSAFPPHGSGELPYEIPTRPIIRMLFRLGNGDTRRLTIADASFGPNSNERTWIGYEPRTRTLISILSRIPINSTMWDEAGPVRSVTDLIGSDVTISFTGDSLSFQDEARRLLARQLLSRRTIQAVLMDLPSFGQLCFSTRRMREGRGPFNRQIFQISLPGSLAELRRLLSSAGEAECLELRPSSSRREVY
jgi:hypothetical protein